ncbi:hypothetical protein LOK49_Contig222G00005 [Camellia lanceoleosa]|nr:hypothetical protein LOK49_Contig222G00005 [Camellia lanceoleosa]
MLARIYNHPGCIVATPIEMPIDPVEGIPLEMPLVHFYGHLTPSVNADLYKVLVKELAQTGEQEKLCSMLKGVLKSKPDVDVVKLQKSGGVVSRNSKVRQKSRSYRIRVLYHQFNTEEQLAALEAEKMILEERKKLKAAGVIGIG